MAGCFGSHPFDRDMERQLMNHLNESNFEEYCENIVSEFDETMWNTGLEKFFESEPKCNEFMEHCFDNGHDPKYCANGITELYKMHTI